MPLCSMIVFCLYVVFYLHELNQIAATVIQMYSVLFVCGILSVRINAVLFGAIL